MIENKNISITGDILCGFTVTISNLDIETLKSVINSFNLHELMEQKMDTSNLESTIVENPQLKEQLIEMVSNLRSGHKLQAVKDLKTMTSAGLKECKEACDILCDNDIQKVISPINLIIKNITKFDPNIREKLLKGFSPAELHQYRGMIQGSKYGI